MIRLFHRPRGTQNAPIRSLSRPNNPKSMLEQHATHSKPAPISADPNCTVFHVHPSLYRSSPAHRRAQFSPSNPQFFVGVAAGATVGELIVVDERVGLGTELHEVKLFDPTLQYETVEVVYTVVTGKTTVILLLLVVGVVTVLRVAKIGLPVLALGVGPSQSKPPRTLRPKTHLCVVKLDWDEGPQLSPSRPQSEYVEVDDDDGAAETAGVVVVVVVVG